MGWYDARMTKDEIETLGRLSRIALTEDEKQAFAGEIEAILNYVSTVKEIAADDVALTPAIGRVANVMRSDEITNDRGEYADILTAAFPDRSGNYLVVKKILSNDK